MNGNTVHKMLSPEELGLLQEISTGLNALIQSAGAGGQEEQPDMMGGQSVMSANKEGNMAPGTTGEEKEVDKSDDGPNANPEDKAEMRTEDGTEVTDQSLMGLAKLLAALNGVTKGKAAPSKNTRNNGGVSAQMVTDAVAKALKPLVDRLDLIEKDQDMLLGALNFADESDSLGSVDNPIGTVQKAVSGNSGMQSRGPVVNPDSTMMIMEIAKALASEMRREQGSMDDGLPTIRYKSAQSEAHKNLGAQVAGITKGRA